MCNKPLSLHCQTTYTESSSDLVFGQIQYMYMYVLCSISIKYDTLHPYIPRNNSGEFIFLSLSCSFFWPHCFLYFHIHILNHVCSLSYFLRFCLLQHYRFQDFLQIWPVYRLKSQKRVSDQLGNLNLSHSVTGYWVSLQTRVLS